MRRTQWFVGLTAVLFALTVVVAAPAQDSFLTEKAAKKAIKAQEKLLKAADKAAKRGDDAAVESNVSEFAASARQLQNQLRGGQVADEDAIDVVAIVDEATRKHLDRLAELRAKFNCGTDQSHNACNGLDRAFEVAGRGHDEATNALMNRASVDLSGQTLDDRTARAAVKKNDALLRHVERAQKRGDNAAVSEALQQFARNQAEINRAIAEGAVDESEAVSVLDRVDRATRKQDSILAGLEESVPEQAREHVARARMEAQRGNAEATAALARTPAGGVRAGRPGQVGPPSGIPAGGRPSGQGGPPAPRPGPPAGGPPSGNRPGPPGA